MKKWCHSIWNQWREWHIFNAQTEDIISHKIYSIQKNTDTESIYDQLMKTNSSNLEISSIDEVLSKPIDHNLVSNKKTSAGLDSFRE